MFFGGVFGECFNGLESVLLLGEVGGEQFIQKGVVFVGKFLIDVCIQLILGCGCGCFSYVIQCGEGWKFVLVEDEFFDYCIDDVGFLIEYFGGFICCLYGDLLCFFFVVVVNV